MDHKADKSGWQRLNEIFAAALELDTVARAAFLDQTCDADLRAEVEALLAANRRVVSQEFLARDILDAATRVLCSSETEETLEGVLIGSYKVVREIGRGGMGAVYLAERADDQFRQQVALKIVKRGMDWHDVVRRFKRERQVLAPLNHPYIARLLDGGRTETGLPFFVMEYVDGLPITTYCDRQNLTIEQRLQLFQKVCSAVSYIHQHQIVHRDVKPMNILVTKDGQPKLLDFGIVKILRSDGSAGMVDQTATGMQLFTPRYASPEQIRGEMVTLTSDIYSLGVLLYELLCGHHPFSVKDATPLMMLKIISEQEPTAPSVAALTSEKVIRDDSTDQILTPETVARSRRQSPDKLRRRLCGDLDNITLKALRKEPGERYQSVAELAEDIRRHLEKLPVSARKASSAYRAAKFVIRHRTGSVAGGLVAILLCAVSAVWAFLYWRSQAQTTYSQIVASVSSRHTIAVLPFKSAGNSDDLVISADLTETLIARLGRIEELEIRPASAVMSFVNKDPLTAGAELKVDAVLESSLELNGDRVRITTRLFKTNGAQILWSGAFEEHLTDISNAQDVIAERVAGTLLGELVVEQRKKVKKRYTDSAEAYKLYLQGKSLRDQQTEESLKRSIQYFNQAILVDPGYALAYSGICDAYMGMSAVYRAPREVIPKAKAAVMRALELDPELAEAHVALALILENYDWNFGAAEAEYKRALDLNSNYASARHWYGRFLALNGRRDESIAQFKRGSELDPLSPFIVLDSNFVDFFAGNYDRSIQTINRALELNDDFWFAYWVRGWAYQCKGEMTAAIADYKTAESLSAGSVIPKAFLAQAYAASGRHGEARQTLNHLLEYRQTRYVGAPSIAAIYAGLGDRDQALLWLEKGYEERDDFMLWIKFDLRFQAIRKDHRFNDLLRRVGLAD